MKDLYIFVFENNMDLSNPYNGYAVVAKNEKDAINYFSEYVTIDNKWKITQHEIEEGLMI